MGVSKILVGRGVGANEAQKRAKRRKKAQKGANLKSASFRNSLQEFFRVLLALTREFSGLSACFKALLGSKH